jgi:hypothetical protein
VQPPLPGDRAHAKFTTTGCHSRHIHPRVQRTPSTVVPYVDVDTSQDCAWREYAYEYAVQVQPWLAGDAGKMGELFDALQLSTLCKKSRFVNCIYHNSACIHS